MTLTFTGVWSSDLDDSFSLVSLMEEKSLSKLLVKVGCAGARVRAGLDYSITWVMQGGRSRASIAEPNTKLVEVVVECLVSWSDEVVRWLDCLAVNWSLASREANNSDSLK